VAKQSSDVALFQGDNWDMRAHRQSVFYLKRDGFH